MIREVYKKWVHQDYNGNINACIKDGFYIDWTDEKIKSAFNFGDGTIKDLKKHIENNKNLCYFLEV